jgi:hypothetical protein
MTTHTQRQEKQYGPRYYTEDGTEYRITATVRHDDRCKNGHNTFSITAQIDAKNARGKWQDAAGGCCHDEVAKHFPELRPVIKWHLTATDGPLHYIANTLYFAGERDCWGLLKGEKRQIKNGKTGMPAWELTLEDGRAARVPEIPAHVDAAHQPPAPAPGLIFSPWNHTGEGKERELDAARRAAVWPDATDADLTAPGLRERLEARHPALMEAFKRDVESLGLTF